jgi:general stress protein YciG
VRIHFLESLELNRRITMANKQGSDQKQPQQGGRESNSKQSSQQDAGRGQQGGGRGFAGMDPQRQREISAEGGRASHGGHGGGQQGGGESAKKQSSQQDSGRGQQGEGRGFAGMDPQRQREIASEGGRAAHASGHAHEFDSREAREAGSRSHGGGRR